MASLHDLLDEQGPDFIDDDVVTGQSLATAVGKAVRHARVESGMTQSEVAQRLGCPQSAVARFEAGRTVPRIDTVFRFASAVGLQPGLALSSRNGSDHDCLIGLGPSPDVAEVGERRDREPEHHVAGG